MPHNDLPLGPDADSADIDPASVAPVSGAVRKCILTGVRGERDALLRLALDNDGNVAPDIAARAPGRGAWVSPDRALIAAALAKGRLRGLLMRAFKTSAVQLPADLDAQIETALARRALDRLGLENRAGHLLWGADRIGDALAAGRVRLLLHAADAAPDGVAKLESRRRAAPRAVAVVRLPADRAQLSMALGRENVVHAAVCDAAASARVATAVERWRAYAGTSDESAATETPVAGQEGIKVRK